MSRKQFTTQTKEKYIKLILSKDFEYALIPFICELDDRYKKYQNFAGRKKLNRSPRLENLFKKKCQQKMII